MRRHRKEKTPTGRGRHSIQNLFRYKALRRAMGILASSSTAWRGERTVETATQDWQALLIKLSAVRSTFAIFALGGSGGADIARCIFRSVFTR